MSGYDYPTYVSAIGASLEVQVSNASAAAPFTSPNYNTWLPRAIEAGEQRIYRELDLLGTRYVDDTGTLTPNQRRFTLPVDYGQFIVVEEVALYVAPSRSVLLPVSKEYLDVCWPSDSATFTPSNPVVWAPFDQATIFVGPAPDSAYGVEVVGTIRPNPLSSTNTSTILTTYVPDLFMAATMVSWMGLQRDYGAQSSDPQEAVSWEQQYQTMMKSAAVEQFRIRFRSQGWSCRLPSPLASPQT